MLSLIDSKKSLEIRVMNSYDLDTVISIENKCFPSPWPKQAFEESLVYNESLVLTSLLSKEIIGFLIGLGVQDEYNICNIAIDPKFHKKGYANYFLSTVIDNHFKKYENYFLEVRRTNRAAIGLYHKLGFKVIYTRSKYYSNPIEDALVMKYCISE